MPGDSDYVFVFSGSDARHYQNNNNRYLSNIVSSSSNDPNSQLQQQSPPSYEEAIRNSINPTHMTACPCPAINHDPSERNIQSSNEIVVAVTENENRHLLNNENKGTNYCYGSSKTPSSPEGDEENMLSPPEYTVSDINFERSPEGVVSCDSKLNREPESLYRFIIEHNDKPEMAIKIHGYHHEEASQIGDSHNMPQDRRVTDFLITLDLTEFILPNGRIYSNDSNVEVMEIINEYVNHKNKLKEIIMKKVIIWDYESLTRAISTIIRQRYRHHIEITYLRKNHIVKVQSDHKFSRFTENRLTKSDFYMSISPRDWYHQNINLILANIKWL
nr:1375_t:CDS:2 [Entrophospora candida]